MPQPFRYSVQNRLSHRTPPGTFFRALLNNQPMGFILTPYALKPGIGSKSPAR